MRTPTYAELRPWLHELHAAFKWEPFLLKRAYVMSVIWPNTSFKFSASNQAALVLSILKITKYRFSTVCLGNLLQSLISLILEVFFILSACIFPCCTLCLLSLVLTLCIYISLWIQAPLWSSNQIVLWDFSRLNKPHSLCFSMYIMCFRLLSILVATH